MAKINTDPGVTSRFRRLSAPLRRLPDFIIIGAMKAGTSSLYSCLVQHPRIKPARVKELHYFNRYYRTRSLNWYRSFFPLRRPGAWITGEATPAYLFYPECAPRIHALLPRARLIVLLRNPVDRAISHYHHMVRQGREQLELMDALAKEAERLAAEQARTTADPDYFSAASGWFSYLGRGRYAEQLQRYWDFFDRSQVMLVKSEDFFAQPDRTLRDAFGFLGLESDPGGIDLTPRNVGGYDGRIRSDAHRYLENYFAGPNRELETLTGICW